LKSLFLISVVGDYATLGIAATRQMSGEDQRFFAPLRVRAVLGRIDIQYDEKSDAVKPFCCLPIPHAVILVSTNLPGGVG
jgi:hypothetical protein